MITLRICCLLFKLVFWCLACDMQDSKPRTTLKISFYLDFSFRALFHLWVIRRLSWNGTFVSHCRSLDNHRMNTSSADVFISKFAIIKFKCWILLKPVLGGFDCSLHLPLTSMNRFNKNVLIKSRFRESNQTKI